MAIQPPAVRSLVYAQAGFFGFLLLAIAINPAVFSANHGLSFLGEHVKSAIPFGLGILTCDYFLLQTADQLKRLKRPLNDLAPALQVLAVLFLLIFLTPDTVDSVFDWSHVIVSFVLFLYELCLTGWLVFLWRRGDNLSRFLWLLLLAAGLVTMFSQFHFIYYLSEGILFFQIIFSLLLVRLVALLVPASKAA